MNMLNSETTQDLRTAKKIRFKEGCCKSYLTPKGRCYTCPEEYVPIDEKENK
ncbi:hypothetical protein HYX11_00915 [Candidatus Woesearchaeota archaeon]|nr:hypothetical protein [Candidatus Woesearchaeota archaeon]